MKRVIVVEAALRAAMVECLKGQDCEVYTIKSHIPENVLIPYGLLRTGKRRAQWKSEVGKNKVLQK